MYNEAEIIYLFMNKKAYIGIGLAALAIVLIAVFASRSNDGSPEADVDNLLLPTAAEDIYEESNRLKVNEGSVTVKRASEKEDEVEAGKETEVEVGDTILVQADSKATLYWFDHSVSRLSAGTELVIDQAAYNPENINETDINIKVVSGEVWSKVQAIVDEDSEFLANAGNVVAGVRGSVFNFAVDGDQVAVSSIAHVIRAEGKTYTSGEWGIFNKETKESVEWGAIPEDKWNEEWFKENMKDDEADQKERMALMMAKLKKAMGAKPGEPEFAERMAKLESFMNSDASEAQKAAVKTKVIGLVRAMDVLPNSPLFETKLMLQEKLIAWEKNEDKKEFLRMKRIEGRLYSLFDWVKSGDLDEAKLQSYLARFENLLGEDLKFFKNNPDLIRLVEKVLKEVEVQYPDMEVLELLRKIDKLDDKPSAKPVWKPAVVIPKASTETKEVIEQEAPFHKGESNV